MTLFPGTRQPLMVITNTLTHTVYSTKQRVALMSIIPAYAQTIGVKININKVLHYLFVHILV
jgi:hypothetical protein